MDTKTLNELNLKGQITRHLLDQLYEGIYFVDMNRTLLFWNKGAELITGYSAFEVIGKTCYDDILCHRDELGNNLCHEGCPLLSAISENKYTQARVYLRNKNGNRIPVWIRVSPLKDKENNIIGAVEIFSDDSRYEELKIANKKLEELNELKNQFLGVAAHDLRNPLTVAISYCSILTDFQNQHLNQDHLAIIKRIKKTSENMLVLVNDLLDISAIESGKIKLNKQDVSIGNLLKVDNYSAKILADQKDINIITIIEPDLPQVNLDPARIDQVMENLLSNAVKFSYPGTKITIKALKENNNLVLTVQDEGQGIPKEEIPSIFKPFEMTSVHSTAKEKSTGLGLAIVKRIIDLHNATIKVESEVNNGTKFIISFPIS